MTQRVEEFPFTRGAKRAPPTRAPGRARRGHPAVDQDYGSRDVTVTDADRNCRAPGTYQGTVGAD